MVNVVQNWLTLANHILRTYIGTLKPNQNLKMLATFVVKIYALMWFNIKINNKCSDGAVNLCKTIICCNYLPADNSFWWPRTYSIEGGWNHPNRPVLISISVRQAGKKLTIITCHQYKCKRWTIYVSIYVTGLYKPWFLLPSRWRSMHWSNGVEKWENQTNWRISHGEWFERRKTRHLSCDTVHFSFSARGSHTVI